MSAKTPAPLAPPAQTSDEQIEDVDPERRRIRPDDAMYLPLPTPLVFVAIYAQQNRMITGQGDLPPAPEDGDDQTAYLRWTQAVHERLDELGAVEKYRASRASRIVGVARCPAWCSGRHEKVNDGDMGIQHVGAEYTTKVSAGVSGLFDFSVVLEQWENAGGELEPAQLAVYASHDITLVDAEDAQTVADIFGRAAAALAAVTMPADEIDPVTATPSSV